jgi:RNA polymerase sigma-70 factor (ECF subfamily)
MEESLDQRQADFEKLVIEHHVRLRAFVRSLGVDPDWVDDVAQEAFLTAFRELDKFDRTRDFGKWLRGIAANIVRNELRKDARRQRILSTELAELLMRQQAESAARTEPVAVDAVRDCIQKLSSISRKVVRGRYHDGLVASEIAEQLDLSAANVRQMLVKIRRQVRQCVELHVLEEA